MSTESHPGWEQEVKGNPNLLNYGNIRNIVMDTVSFTSRLRSIVNSNKDHYLGFVLGSTGLLGHEKSSVYKT